MYLRTHHASSYDASKKCHPRVKQNFILEMYFRFETKVPIEVEVTISRSGEDIMKMLKRLLRY